MKNVIELLKAGRKIEAIKEFRALYGVGLLEGKHAVEAIAATLHVPSTENRTETLGAILIHNSVVILQLTKLIEARKRPIDAMLMAMNVREYGKIVQLCQDEAKAEAAILVDQAVMITGASLLSDSADDKARAASINRELLQEVAARHDRLKARTAA